MMLGLQSANATKGDKTRSLRDNGVAQHRHRRNIILPFATLDVGLIAASLVPRQPALIWNFSPSLAEGLYRIEDRTWRRGDLVALRPSGAAGNILDKHGALPHHRLLLKRVVAGAGDVVCRERDSVSINGVHAAVAKQTGSGGQPLPAWSGCSTLSPDTVFLLGDHPASLDGRYFGPVPASSIVGVISPLVTFPDQGALQQ